MRATVPVGKLSLWEAFAKHYRRRYESSFEDDRAAPLLQGEQPPTALDVFSHPEKYMAEWQRREDSILDEIFAAIDAKIIRVFCYRTGGAQAGCEDVSALFYPESIEARVMFCENYGVDRDLDQANEWWPFRGETPVLESNEFEKWSRNLANTRNNGSAADERKAILYLMAVLEERGESITRKEATVLCTGMFNVTAYAMKTRIWPSAREKAGLPTRAPGGRKPNQKPAE